MALPSIARSRVTNNGSSVIGRYVMGIFGMGHVHVARQLDCILHSQYLSHDADSDLSRGFAANVDTNRATQALQLQFGESHVLLHSLVTRSIVSA